MIDDRKGRRSSNEAAQHPLTLRFTRFKLVHTTWVASASVGSVQRPHSAATGAASISSLDSSHRVRPAKRSCTTNLQDLRRQTLSVDLFSLSNPNLDTCIHVQKPCNCGTKVTRVEFCSSNSTHAPPKYRRVVLLGGRWVGTQRTCVPILIITDHGQRRGSFS